MGIDLADKLFEGMRIDVICPFEDSSKKPNIDLRARSLIGNLGIKAIDNLIAFCLGHTEIGILRSYRDLIIQIY